MDVLQTATVFNFQVLHMNCVMMKNNHLLCLNVKEICSPFTSVYIDSVARYDSLARSAISVATSPGCLVVMPLLYWRPQLLYCTTWWRQSVRCNEERNENWSSCSGEMRNYHVQETQEKRPRSKSESTLLKISSWVQPLTKVVFPLPLRHKALNSINYLKCVHMCCFRSGIN